MSVEEKTSIIASVRIRFPTSLTFSNKLLQTLLKRAYVKALIRDDIRPLTSSTGSVLSMVILNKLTNQAKEY